MMLQNGDKIDHFEIIRRLGAGGMGEVFLARDTRLNREVALKILHADFLGDDERRQRFMREARSAAGISHPNVAAIYDLGQGTDPQTGQELHYIVMEYIAGQSLSDYLKNSPGDIKTLIRLAEKIASGLAAAHKVNIAHRDIKPDNIIIDADENPKILDFGLAKPVAPVQMEDSGEQTDTISQELTRAGKIVGTVSYMSPEQIKGDPVDSRTDIFSFGIVLYRMVTGVAPFEGDTQVSTLAKILESQPESPRLKNEGIPSELERIVNKCLHKNAADRYQDTRDLVVDLRNLRREFDSSVSGQFSGVIDKTESGGGWKTINRAALGIVAILIIAGVIWKLLPGQKSDIIPTVTAGENTLAILGFENKTGDDDLDWLETGLPEILLTDLAQNQSLSIISRDRIMDCLRREGKDIEISTSHTDCLDAARQLGAQHALSGTFYKLGDQIRIDARLEEIVTGKIILTEKVQGAEPFVLVDSLTGKIATQLNIADNSQSEVDFTTFTSTSPESYREYHEAMKLFGAELYDQAIEGFMRAIAIDSTFALPYMRIGMAHIFEGRQDEGKRWFMLANKYAGRLPLRERNLLDIYTNTWVTSKFDDAFTKMERLVDNYPDDKEARSIYALMLFTFNSDTTAAFAQFDSALIQDPQYLFALSQKGDTYRKLELYDQALELIHTAHRYHPESPTPPLQLARIYLNQDKYDKAINAYREVVDKFPDQSDALMALHRVYILTGDFDQAQYYLNLYKERFGDDPFNLMYYYNAQANLELWQGHFKKHMDNLIEGLKAAHASGDQAQTSGFYSSIADFYISYKMYDSALFYNDKLLETANMVFQKIDYPINLVKIDRAYSDSATLLFEQYYKEISAMLPEGMMPMVTGVRKMFEGLRDADTLRVINGIEGIISATSGNNTGNKRTLGYRAAQIGQYEKAIKMLEPSVIGDNKSSSANSYLRSVYYLAISYEGIGQIEKAKEYYEEFLKYWGDADRQLEQIVDAQKRLARLTS